MVLARLHCVSGQRSLPPRGSIARVNPAPSPAPTPSQPPLVPGPARPPPRSHEPSAPDRRKPSTSASECDPILDSALPGTPAAPSGLGTRATRRERVATETPATSFVTETRDRGAESSGARECGGPRPAGREPGTWGKAEHGTPTSTARTQTRNSPSSSSSPPRTRRTLPLDDDLRHEA